VTHDADFTRALGSSVLEVRTGRAGLRAAA
jgi:hypothetical protein